MAPQPLPADKHRPKAKNPAADPADDNLDDQPPGPVDPIPRSTLEGDTNAAIVVGELVAAAVRELPSGTELLELSLTVRAESATTTSVPVVWRDPPARAKRWKPGNRVIVYGRVVRRFYQAGGRLASRTEVEVFRASTVGHRRALASVARSFMRDLDAAGLNDVSPEKP